MSDDLSRPFPRAFIAAMTNEDLRRMCAEAHRHRPGTRCWVSLELARRAAERRAP